jgi:hypothetical protein
MYTGAPLSPSWLSKLARYWSRSTPPSSKVTAAPSARMWPLRSSGRPEPCTCTVSPRAGVAVPVTVYRVLMLFQIRSREMLPPVSSVRKALSL